ncbi:MAG: YeaC family protein [Candidatus Pelagadaptatus aseana]|uniref:YeaC family protein n=1 Tax=Candidatus Pelagadaptatus aseana TaxID=3120508 RepID=UPI0039B206C9
MDIKQLLESITPDIYENLKTAIELGKWADGRKLDQEQKELCMQAVIAYEQMHVPAEERTGYIPPKSHSHCGGEGDVAEPEGEKPLKWQ